MIEFTNHASGRDRELRRFGEELALNVGTPVYVTFKSSAVHVLDPVS